MNRELGLAWFGILLMGALFIIAMHQKGTSLVLRDASWLGSMKWGSVFYNFVSFIIGFGAVHLVVATLSK